MRWRAIGITALFGIASAVAIACGGGGGGDTTTIVTRASFPQGFLPVLLEGSLLADPCQSSVSRTAGDVAFRGSEGESDLFAVAQSREVFAISRTNGSCSVFGRATVGTRLLSLVQGFGDDARFFAGDDVGQIWVFPTIGGDATVYKDTGTGQRITGLVFAPTGYGDVTGSLLAAAGTAGVVRITIGDTPVASTFAASPGGAIVDLAFSGTTLFAIRSGEIDKIEASGTTGTVTTFQTGFVTPVGIAVDSVASEIYVADAGDDIVKTVPLAGGTPTKRARYDFDTFGADGLAFDGIATLAWITKGPLAIRASSLPRIAPANPNFGQSFSGPTSGYGDLELDRVGAFVLVANDDVDPLNNFLFRVPRDAGEVSTLESGIGIPAERMFGVAVDPVSQAIYFSSFTRPPSVEIGNIYKRDADGNVSLLVGLTPGIRIFGLELAPPTFGSFGGDLIATTEDGHVFAIDPAAPSTPVEISLSPLSPPIDHLVDLVFATTGELYAVENNGSPNLAISSRIFSITPSGTVTVLVSSSAQLGGADGIEIDEGADRLLVTTQVSTGFQLLEVSLGAIPATIKPLANIEIDDGLFPTGVVYDRLGTAVFRRSTTNNNTQLGAVSVAP